MEERHRSSRLSVSGWHQRFSQQAAWTRSLRVFLYQSYPLSTARRVLEVGCGTGAITGDLPEFTSAQVFGVDIRLDTLQFTAENQPATHCINADGLALPLPNGGMDAAFCHFLLLWVRKPSLILAEMRRVTRSGGVVLALAEPDYGGRLDYPDELSRLGQLQTQSLKAQGANPFIGRELNHLFHQAGLTQVHFGVLGGEWKEPLPNADLQSEWMMIENDLAGLVSADELTRLSQARSKAAEQGNLTLFVPTFYAAGIVPPA